MLENQNDKIKRHVTLMTKAGNDKYNNVNMKTFLKWIISTIYLITMTHDYDILYKVQIMRYYAMTMMFFSYVAEMCFHNIKCMLCTVSKLFLCMEYPDDLHTYIFHSTQPSTLCWILYPTMQCVRLHFPGWMNWKLLGTSCFWLIIIVGLPKTKTFLQDDN